MYLKDVINRIDPADIKQISQIVITNLYSVMYVSLTVAKMEKKTAAKKIDEELQYLGYHELCEIPVESFSLCKSYDKYDSLELVKLFITLRNDDRLYKYSLKGTVEYVAGTEDLKE